MPIDDPRCLPSCEDRCPAMPFQASGSGLPQCRGFATAVPVVDAFATPRSSCEHRGAWVPVHVLPCHGKSRFSEPRRRSPTSATEFDARTHPTSRRSSRASGTFVPLLAGTNRCQLRWPDRCVAAPGACEPRSASRRLSPSRSTCVEGAEHGPEHSSKGERALLTMCACPSRGAPGTRVTGSIRRLAWMTWRLLAPAEILLGCNLAKGHTVERIEVPSVAMEPLRERRIAPSCAPGSRLRHAASFGGFARELARLCYRSCLVPSSDEDSTKKRLDLSEQWEPKPHCFDGSQHPSRRLRTNHLAVHFGSKALLLSICYYHQDLY